MRNDIKYYFEYLKNALDASYLRHEDKYNSMYSNMSDFYKEALNSMNNNKFDFITGNYRDYIKNNYGIIFLNAYLYSVVGYARNLQDNYASKDYMTSQILSKLNSVYEYDNKRHFSEMASFVDNDLSNEKPNTKRKILENILLGNKVLDIKQIGHEELYKFKNNKNELLLLLVENTYRLYNLLKHNGPYINLLNENIIKIYDPTLIETANYNRKRVISLMENLTDVASFINNLNEYSIRQMIDLYVISRNNRRNHAVISTSSNIMTDDSSNYIFKQFENKDILNRINTVRTY